MTEEEWQAFMRKTYHEKESQKESKGEKYLRNLCDTLLTNLEPKYTQMTKALARHAPLVSWRTEPARRQDLMKQAEGVFEAIAQLDGSGDGSTISKEELIEAHKGL